MTQAPGQVKNPGQADLKPAPRRCKKLPATFIKICQRCKGALRSPTEAKNHVCADGHQSPLRALKDPADRKKIPKANEQSSMTPNAELAMWRKMAKMAGASHVNILTLEQCQTIVAEFEEEKTDAENEGLLTPKDRQGQTQDQEKNQGAPKVETAPEPAAPTPEPAPEMDEISKTIESLKGLGRQELQDAAAVLGYEVTTDYKPSKTLQQLEKMMRSVITHGPTG